MRTTAIVALCLITCALVADEKKPNDPTLGLTFGLSLILALWSANAGVGALFDGVNIAYGESEKRAWWRRLVLTLSFTAGGVVVMTSMLATPRPVGNPGHP